MSCEICGRSSCTRSFHSLTEQERFDNPSAPAPASDGLTDEERGAATVEMIREFAAPTPPAGEGPVVTLCTVEECSEIAVRGTTRCKHHPAPSAANEEAAELLEQTALNVDERFPRDAELYRLAARALRQPPMAVDEVNKIAAFLLGEQPLDGVWFGEKHPAHAGLWWWRSRLRAALQAALAKGGE